jgi:DNA polymerase elongation subunit (family B)
MLDLYKKYTYTTRESYTLDFISQEELGVGKLDHSEFANFKDFYTNGFSKYLEYNTIDVKRVAQLESKMKLIELCLTMAYLAKINYSEVYSQMKMWDAIIYNHLKDNNIVIPKKSNSSKSEQFEGAYVKEPIPGLYKWGISVDAKSLYPSILQGWNISPETFMGMSNTPLTVDKLINQEYNNLSDIYCTAASGAMYSKDKQGLLPDLVDLYMSKRVIAKNLMKDNERELEVLKKELKCRGL